jgi:hypothetical protein
MAMAEAKDDASSNGAGEEDATGTPVFGILDDDDAEGSDQKNHKADNEEVESAKDKEEEDAKDKEEEDKDEDKEMQVPEVEEDVVMIGEDKAVEEEEAQHKDEDAQNRESSEKNHGKVEGITKEGKVEGDTNEGKVEGITKEGKPRHRLKRQHSHEEAPSRKARRGIQGDGIQGDGIQAASPHPFDAVQSPLETPEKTSRKEAVVATPPSDAEKKPLLKDQTRLDIECLIETLEKQIAVSVAEKRYSDAAKMQAELEQKQSLLTHACKGDLERRLEELVHQRDFVGAAAVQAQIEELSPTKPSSPKALAELEAARTAAQNAQESWDSSHLALESKIQELLCTPGLKTFRMLRYRCFHMTIAPLLLHTSQGITFGEHFTSTCICLPLHESFQ